MNHEEIAQTVIGVVANVLKCEPRKEISRESHPGWDSFNHVEIVFSLEEHFKFEFPPEAIPHLNSISSLVDQIVSHVSEQKD